MGGAGRQVTHLLWAGQVGRCVCTASYALYAPCDVVEAHATALN